MDQGFGNLSGHSILEMPTVHCGSEIKLKSLEASAFVSERV